MSQGRSSTGSKLGAVLVTGVSSGIGRAIAEALLTAGYTVFGSIRKPGDAEGLKAYGKEQFVPLVFDVTDAAAIARAVNEVAHWMGDAGLAGLVNNAGINISGPFLHQPAKQFKQVVDVNFHGLVAVTHAFLPLLGASGAARQSPGRIVNIGSVQGTMTVPFMSAYAASKHAVEAFAQGLRREMIPFGISVSTIEPNFTRSDLFAKAVTDSAANTYVGTVYQAAWAQFNTAIAAAEAGAKPASTVTRKVLHALQSPRPRPRYPLDPMWHLGRFLPDRLFDRLIFKGLGITAMLRPHRRNSWSES
ncbi:SDR family NAD(P)-dependent oxidoreductase [Novosphingobium sp. MMS21-SN21R]|uniref:SDR family NAD(P)-dependent oxidoreductase n=1 Tax=Novosphingobium sp. MMS21-SN21R TaxID=2969298 RepID=UPI0028854CD7|nr:SDR family NAD(P)-dependent oxidoreductase [Novosphingobium sp. MMS21-SN21R]MDT0507021.1 SDR family NAD(P)-dependent oxidoreductase [Novosphingobium sp. MMS21-SN21R]